MTAHQIPISLSTYDGVVVNLSGGKDSQVTLDRICAGAERAGVLGRVRAVHADTGSEWPQSAPHCAYLCGQYGVPFEVVRPRRPLAESIRRRGMWPSNPCRYCTSDHKRDPIAALVRRHWPARSGARILVVSGERAEESPHRARLPAFAVDGRLTVSGRAVHQWRPILDLGEAQVWAEIERSGLRHHVAYDWGCRRVSCILCVLASENDLRIGAEHNPEMAKLYLRIEADIGHTFRHRRPLADILQAGGDSRGGRTRKQGEIEAS